MTNQEIEVILKQMPIETTILTEKKIIEKMKLSKEEKAFSKEVLKYLERNHND